MRSGRLGASKPLFLPRITHIPVDSEPTRRPRSGRTGVPWGLHDLRPCEKPADRMTSADVNREAVDPAYRLRDWVDS